MELKQGSSIPETANKARFACFPPSMFIARLTCSTSSSLVGCRCVIRLRVQQLSFLLQKQLHCAAAKRAAKFRNSRRDGVLNGWISGLVHVPVPRGEEFADESNAMQVQVPRLHKTWRAFTFTFPRMFSWYFLLSITSSLFFFFALCFSVCAHRLYLSGSGLGRTRMFAVSSYASSVDRFKTHRHGFPRSEGLGSVK